jgi:hypothetical protein
MAWKNLRKKFIDFLANAGEICRRFLLSENTGEKCGGKMLEKLLKICCRMLLQCVIIC